MKVGITFSCFDLLHAGHVIMLEEAKSKCDYLIVGLQTNPQIDRPDKSKPIQSVFERYSQLKACKFVDEIIPYETEDDLIDILQSRNIHIRIIGSDYFGQQFTGREYCKESNIEIHYNSRKHRFSSSALKASVIKNNIKGSESISYPVDNIPHTGSASYVQTTTIARNTRSDI